MRTSGTFSGTFLGALLAAPLLFGCASEECNDRGECLFGALPDGGESGASGESGESGASGETGEAAASGSGGTPGGTSGTAGMPGGHGGTFGSSGASGYGGAEPEPQCLEATDFCENGDECCDGLECGSTTLGQVCCGMELATCATDDGEDCCGDLWCLAGKCAPCEWPCTPAPGLSIERQRLEEVIGGSFLGICGDANHTFGYHVAAASLPPGDASMLGAANEPVCDYHAAAIDIGMDWPASREWLLWLIEQIATDEITGVAEVIGSYDGYYVRYWSDASGWSYDGVPYQGAGHDTHTHVSIYRSTTLEDHGILAGWTATHGP
jgi:hypothetical protein